MIRRIDNSQREKKRVKKGELNGEIERLKTTISQLQKGIIDDPAESERRKHCVDCGHKKNDKRSAQVAEEKAKPRRESEMSQTRRSYEKMMVGYNR